MSSNACDQSHDMPLPVQRSIRRYAPRLRAAITAAVQERMEAAEREGRQIRPEEIGECAAHVIFGGAEYDEHMEKMCISAYHAGKSMPLKEVIDDLASRVARPATVSS